MLTVFNYLMAAAFFLSAVVQYNDSDGLYWALFYLAAVAACLRYAPNRSAWPPAVVGILAAALCLWLTPQFIGTVDASKLMQENGMRYSGVEQAREAGGALLVAMWMAVLFRAQAGQRA